MPKQEMKTLHKQTALPESSLVQHRCITETHYPITATQGFSSSQAETSSTLKKIQAETPALDPEVLLE